jgi:tetratricopeptide (TPR) repeat protein
MSQRPLHDNPVVEAVNRAFALARNGRVREAAVKLAHDPGAMASPLGRNARGVLLMQAGDTDAALAEFDHAVALEPGFADAHANRGAALQRQEQLDAALAAYETALCFAPTHANAAFNRGNVLKLLNRPVASLKAFDAVIAARPGFAEGYINRARIHGELRDHEAALADFERALSLQPSRADAAMGRVSALVELRRFDDALAAIDAVLAAEPANGDATLIRAQILIELERESEALTVTERFTGAAGPTGSKAGILRSFALWRLNRRAEAVEVGIEVARHFPDDRQTHQSLAQFCLALGDFERGWAEYEYRSETFDPRQAAIERQAPRWRGENLADRTILVSAEQGLGDTIQFLRLLPFLHARGASVKALVQPALLSLARSLSTPVTCFDHLDNVGNFDFQIPLLSLPCVLGIRMETIPKAVPYLAADPGKVALWDERLAADDRLCVGIAWQGNPAFRNDRRRSVPLRFFAPLAKIPRVRLISLQAVHGLDQLTTLPGGMSVETLGDAITANPDGMAEIAAVMANLDLVISSDTAVAHLAGALGRPVWLALSDDPDWRWLFDRRDSPWYPTMRLFRQKNRGDWSSVFAGIAAALGEITSSAGSGASR